MWLSISYTNNFTNTVSLLPYDEQYPWQQVQVHLQQAIIIIINNLIHYYHIMCYYKLLLLIIKIVLQKRQLLNT